MGMKKKHLAFPYDYGDVYRSYCGRYIDLKLLNIFVVLEEEHATCQTCKRLENNRNGD